MAYSFAFFVLSTLASAAISMLFPSEGPRLKDLSLSASTYGNTIPEVYGAVRVAGDMIWSTGIHENKTKQKMGKGQYSNIYAYSVDFAMAFCKGPAQLRRVWANGKLIYDATGASTNVTTYQMRWHPGDEDQLPDPRIQADKGVENTPAHRGLAYAVFENFPLENYGNAMPQMAAEVFVGYETGVPFTDLVPMDPPDLTGGAQGFTLTDFDRGYIYMASMGYLDRGIRRFRLSDGVEDRDSGNQKFQGLFSYGCPNSDLIIMQTATADGGISSYMEIVRLDAYSFAGLQSLGESRNIPPPPVFVYDEEIQPDYFATSQKQWVRAPNGLSFMCYGIAGTSYIFYWDPVELKLRPLNKPGEPYQFGNLYDSRNGCSSGTTFYTLVGGGILSTPNVAILYSGGAPVYTLHNPEPAISGYTPRHIAYDVGNPGVLMFHQNSAQTYLSKWSPTSNTLLWTLKVPGVPGWSYQASRIYNGRMAWAFLNRLYIVDTIQGTFVDREGDMDHYLGGSQDQSVFGVLRTNPGEEGYALPAGTADADQMYDGQTGALVCCPGFGSSHQSRIIHTGAFSSPHVSLGLIVERLLRSAGLTGTDFDLAPLYTVPIRGYGFANSTDVKNILLELRQIYLFDLVESDGKLVATLRSDTSVVEAVNYLGLASQGGGDADTSDYWKETRVSEADLPAQINLTFMDATNDFQANTARSKRIVNPIPTMFSRQQVSVEASVVMEPTEAKNHANEMLYVQWGERTKHNTKMPWAYAYLDPSDLITVTLPNGRTYNERIDQTEMGADFSINMETRGQDSGAYIQDFIASDSSGVSQVIPSAQIARAFIFNTPYLREIDATAGQNSTFSLYYAGVGNTAPGTFNGATVFYSNDGQNYNRLLQQDQSVEWASVAGVLPLPTHGCHALDWGNEIVVWPAIDNVMLESVDFDDLWADANLSIIGNEVIQFKDAEDNGDGSWTLRNLLRGRRGTEWACDTHTIGEAIVFLDALSIDILTQSFNQFGHPVLYKAVGVGSDLFAAPVSNITYEPRDLMPYAVAGIKRSFSGSDIALTWNRRTRFNGNLRDLTGTVPLNETSEAYEIYILDAPFAGDLSKPDAPATYVRMLASTSETVTYTAAEMTANGFDMATDTLYVVIYQLSGAIGRGFPTARTIEANRTD